MTTYSDIIKKFEEGNYWGLSSAIHIKKCNKKKIRSAEAIEEYVIELCKVIEMLPYGEPHIVHFGINEKVCGYSLMQFIETSSITGHFVERTNSAYIDIFSCKLYNPYEAGKFTAIYFDACGIDVDILFRADD